MRKLIYQDEVIADIDAFLNAVSSTGSITGGWRQYWSSKDIDEAVHYQNKIKNVPHICTKVPTGGGKTYIGCRSLRHIFSQLLPTKEKLVIWLVPSDSILTQTVKALSDPRHPYRRKLDADFAGRNAAASITDQLQNHYQIRKEPPPVGKDCNDYLMLMKQRQIARDNHDSS